MTGQPQITDTHTWDGTHTLPDWLHWDGGLTIPGRDDTTPPQPGWTLVRWSDGHITVASPQVAARVYGPDGMRGRLERAEAELAKRAEVESADAAAGSYAGRAEAAEARLERARAECDRLDAAVRANPTNPDFDGAYLAAVRHVRDVLDSEEAAATWPAATRWLHIAFTSPDETTANTSALALRDHLTAEFDGIRMRMTTNAVEGGPSCSPSTEETEPNNPAATEAAGIETTARVLAALHRSAEDTVTRVIDLHERWSLAGPPLGKSMTGYFEWWRSHLAELHDAINPPAEQPARTTAKIPAATEATDVGNKPDTPACTPPSPGSTREQLPETLLALIDVSSYESTACETATALAFAGSLYTHRRDEISEWVGRLHVRCRLNHKFTGALCICPCHPEERQP